MPEEPFDTYIDFGFEDEASSAAPPAVAQNLPGFLVEILEALQSGPPLPQVEEPTNASTYSSVPDSPSAFPSQSTSAFYHSFPTSPGTLGSASNEVYPATCVRPSDTIYNHHISSFTSPTPPAPSPHQYIPLVAPHPLLAKRPLEQWENSSHPEQSSPRKRQRSTSLHPSPAYVGHPSSSISALPRTLEIADGATAREPVVQSTTWGVLPWLANNAVAGPSTVHVEKVPGPRISQKRARNDENNDGSPTSNKRPKMKMVALAEAPEVLNAPPATYPRFHSGNEYGLLPALAEDEPPATRFVNLPALTPEFYKELCDIAFEIAQGLRQSSGIDGASTYQDAPGPSATTYPVDEPRQEGPPTTRTRKRRRSKAPSEQPPQKRQCTDNSTDATTPEKPFECPFAACPQRFTRATDIIRHVRAKHLGVEVFCMNSKHPQPVRVVREDGVFRHLGFNTCIGAQARAGLVKECEGKKKKEEEKKKKKKKEKKEIGDAKIKETRQWRADVRKRVCRMFARVQMPCYYRYGRFWEALEYLPGWTAKRLENWFSSYGEVKRCRCERCLNISDEELRGEVRIHVRHEPGDANRSRSVSPVAGPSSTGAGARSSVYSDVGATPDDAEWDDKLPPEEEEGVDEDLPQAPPPATDPAAVVAQDDDTIGTAGPSENIGDVCPELQAIYDILSGLSEPDLQGLLRSPDGSQPEIDPTLEREIDSL